LKKVIKTYLLVCIILF